MPKRLFLDIETSHNVGLFFSLWKPTISPGDILRDWTIFCGAYAWEHEDVIHAVWADPVDDDSAVVQELGDVIADADEIVYHNGKRFDFKKLQTRAIFHRHKPIPKPRECDTLLQAKKHFGFTSNRLDYIAHYLGFEGKMSTEPRLWHDVLRGDKKALQKMVQYNIQDVEVLIDVYNTMAPYMDTAYNMSVDVEGDVCPTCGSENLTKRGWYTTLTAKIQRLQCQDCGKWSKLMNKKTR